MFSEAAVQINSQIHSPNLSLACTPTEFIPTTNGVFTDSLHISSPTNSPVINQAI
jgi:hypothetical protein